MKWTLAFLLLTASLPECAGEGFVLVGADGSTAAIVTATHPTPSARLAALELQYHVEKITGARLRIVTDESTVTGPVVLVGESLRTRALGLCGADFASQEYLVRVTPERIVVIGKDWSDSAANRAEDGIDTNYEHLGDRRIEVDYEVAIADHEKRTSSLPRITLPGPYDDQGTCYAVYDFLERCCGVRWYGPGSDDMAFTPRAAIEIDAREIRRAPVMTYRMGTPTWDWPIMKAQWGNPAPAAVALYFRRMRLGGEKWAANHSFRSFRDRFFERSPSHPELFEGRHPEFFAQGRTGGGDSLQLCYTNPALIRQVAKDARAYFDGQGLKGQQVAIGDYFALVPLDNDAWCQCEACQRLLALDRDNFRGEHFNSGRASHYWFTFVNAVAREVARTHPGRRIATLAYHVYAYRPTDLPIEPNVSVAPCLQVRNYWAPRIAAHEAEIYRSWTEPKDRPIYLWNYYCFPEEPAFLSGKWNCFPGLSAHRIGAEIKRYAGDGVRGVFLCGLGEQLDFYVSMKLYDDPTTNVDALLDEFFVRYFGAAAKPMREFYLRIENTFSDPNSYPASLIAPEKQLHQTEEIAWNDLGTEERMTDLARMIQQAGELAKTPQEKARVGSWRIGVWQPMLEGRRKFLERVADRPLPGPAKG